MSVVHNLAASRCLLPDHILALCFLLSIDVAVCYIPSTHPQGVPPMPRGTHDALDDPRNEHIRIYINGQFFPRSEARISVFDGGYLTGDGIWEGLRLHDGVLVFLNEHLDRLFQGAKAISLDIGL